MQDVLNSYTIRIRSRNFKESLTTKIPVTYLTPQIAWEMQLYFCRQRCCPSKFSIEDLQLLYSNPNFSPGILDLNIWGSSTAQYRSNRVTFWCFPASYRHCNQVYFSAKRNTNLEDSLYSWFFPQKIFRHINGSMKGQFKDKTRLRKTYATE